MPTTEAKKYVLVVDDDPICLATLSKDLSGLGYGAETATSGKEALTLLNADPQKYAAVLIDRVMPESSGLALADDIHREPKLAHLPLIMMTTDADSLEQLDAMNHGIDEFIYKPVEANLLSFTLQTVLSQDQQSFL